MSTQNRFATSWSSTYSTTWSTGEETDARRRDCRLTRLGRTAARRESALLARLVALAEEAGLLPDAGRRSA